MRNRVLSLLTGVAGLTLAAASASAADLPARAAPPAPIIAAAPVFTWTGFYAGVNAGYGWRNSDRESVVLGGAVPGTLFFDGGDDGGFVLGGQIGYNYQIGSFVISNGPIPTKERMCGSYPQV
jgi:outer membrane immunogenic protein